MKPKRRHFIAKLSASLCGVAFLIPALTLRPVDRSDWAEDTPYAGAVKIAESIRQDLADLQPSSLEAGWAVLPLSAKPGVPLAGYGARESAPSIAGGETLYARALYLRNDSTEVAIITADLLLVHAGTAKAVHRLLANHGLPPESVYFTATHTHCGPGGWGPNRIEQAVCGKYDPAVVETLAGDLSRTILAAKAAAKPAHWSWLETSAPEYVRNRTVKGGKTDPSLEALAVRQPESGEVGVFAFFGAHATCMGPEQMAFHADYPGFFVREWEQQAQVAFAAFGSGAAGSQSPVGTGKKERRARDIGTGLAAKLSATLPSANWKTDIALGTARRPVPLPEFQIRVSGDIRVSQWLARRLHGDTAPIHFLYLDNRRMVGLPVEYSAMLSAPLRKKAKEQGLELTPTVFNGDYIGYVLPPEIYDNGSYETRMNFLGPGGGAFFSDLIRKGSGMK